jgi:hypothetical protein
MKAKKNNTQTTGLSKNQQTGQLKRVSVSLTPLFVVACLAATSCTKNTAAKVAQAHPGDTTRIPSAVFEPHIHLRQAPWPHRMDSVPHPDLFHNLHFQDFGRHSDSSTNQSSLGRPTQEYPRKRNA